MSESKRKKSVQITTASYDRNTPITKKGYFKSGSGGISALQEQQTISKSKDTKGGGWKGKTKVIEASVAPGEETSYRITKYRKRKKGSTLEKTKSRSISAGRYKRMKARLVKRQSKMESSGNKTSTSKSSSGNQAKTTGTGYYSK